MVCVLCVYSLSLLSCAETLRWVDPLSKESYRLCIGSRTEKGTKAKQWAVETLMMMIIIIKFHIARISSPKSEVRHVLNLATEHVDILEAEGIAPRFLKTGTTRKTVGTFKSQ
jgi:hypothetical protein